MSLNDGSPTIFLLTPLREGRPTIRAMQTHAATISTHAPAGGATRKIDSVNQGLCISTHAPAGGATGRAGDAHFGLHISTHAPAGGAT